MKHLLSVIFLLHCLGKIILSQNSDLYKDTRLRHWDKERSMARLLRERRKWEDSNIPEGFKEATVFPDESTMLEMGGYAKVGAIAYVKDGKFFGKSSRGWTPFIMGPPLKNNILPTLLTKISETKVEKMNISETNFKNRVLCKENSNHSTLKLVALNDPLSGGFGGINIANFKCQQEAIEAGQDGIFRAFLASKNLNLAEILDPEINCNYRIVNIKGTKLFESYDSLRNHMGLWPFNKNYPLSSIYSFDERNIILDEHWPLNKVWHGPAKNGYAYANDSDCNDWTSSEFEDVGLAADYLQKGLFDNHKEPCNETLIVLCIEIGMKLNNTRMGFDEHMGILLKYESEYVKNKNGRDHPDGESSSAQSDSNSISEDDYTKNTDNSEP